VTCRELVDRLGAELEGLLSAPEREAVDGHLAVCPPCRVFREKYQATVAIARAAGARETEDPDAARLAREILAARERG